MLSFIVKMVDKVLSLHLYRQKKIIHDFLETYPFAIVLDNEAGDNHVVFMLASLPGEERKNKFYLLGVDFWGRIKLIAFSFDNYIKDDNEKDFKVSNMEELYSRFAWKEKDRIRCLIDLEEMLNDEV